ncbi:MAG: molybdenum cofactor guanylyltransferase [Polyangiaceae bacterium]|nr:molybdenum cofactor guanylyltransferase [Polyangiaceae bacterium]
MSAPLVGIFVGGKGRRMGGVAKGLLTAPGGDETLVARLVRVVREAYGDVDLVLVGSAEAYAAHALPSLSDDPPGVGPIGGLAALLAEGRRRGAPFVVTLACDLPYVSAALLTRLRAHAPGASAVAARQGTRWQPLCARFDPNAAHPVAQALAAAGTRSLQPVLDQLSCIELPLDTDQDLRDWDEPGDVE